MTVAGKPEQDHPLLTGLLRRFGFLDDGADRMGRFRAGNDPFGAGEEQRRLEGRTLGNGGRLDETLVNEGAEAGGIAVIPEASA